MVDNTQRSLLPPLDYEKDVQIDVHALDVEWVNQAALSLRYGKLVARWRREVNRLEELKKTTRSELIIEANKHPETCCNKKNPNAADIEAYYRANDKYKTVIEEYNKALYELEYAEVAKSEITFTRRSALENLVRLHLGNYFAGPRVPRDLAEEVAKSRGPEAQVRIRKPTDEQKV